MTGRSLTVTKPRSGDTKYGTRPGSRIRAGSSAGDQTSVSRRWRARRRRGRRATGGQFVSPRRGPLKSLSRPNASTAPITFWDMEWGASAYNTEGAALVAQYNKLYPKYQRSLTRRSPGPAGTRSMRLRSRPIPTLTGAPGAGYQTFQFSQAGAIQPLDDLVAQMTKDGIVADFEPGTLDVLKYQGHYVAIPWEINIRVLYYRKSILGSDVPKTWDDLLTLGKALKKKGIYVLNSAGNASFNGWQFLPIMFMLGNGGGFFNAKGEPDTLSAANVEAVEFMLQLSKDGYLDPASISSTRLPSVRVWFGQSGAVRRYAEVDRKLLVERGGQHRSRRHPSSRRAVRAGRSSGSTTSWLTRTGSYDLQGCTTGTSATPGL